MNTRIRRRTPGPRFAITSFKIELIREGTMCGMRFKPMHDIQHCKMYTHAYFLYSQEKTPSPRRVSKHMCLQSNCLTARVHQISDQAGVLGAKAALFQVGISGLCSKLPVNKGEVARQHFNLGLQLMVLRLFRCVLSLKIGARALKLFMPQIPRGQGHACSEEICCFFLLSSSSSDAWADFRDSTSDAWADFRDSTSA